MNSRYRLTRSNEFERVRQFGKSYSNLLLVLIANQNDLDRCRFAVVASRAIGKAVQRNRTKRELRACVRQHLSTIESGWDIILIARKPIIYADYWKINAALISLVREARLFVENPLHDNP